MAKTIPQPVVFARVKGNVILEYPITSEEIHNRKIPFSSFVNVVYLNNPKVEDHQTYDVQKAVVGKEVHVTFVVRNMTLDELLTYLLVREKQTNREATRVSLSNVTMEDAQAVSQATEVEAVKRLNELARSRRYDSIDSAASFRDSHIEKFRDEAARMIYLRSQLFADLEQYETKVLTGELPVPRSASEVFSHLVPIVWE
jgi:hypothetical protein